MAENDIVALMKEHLTIETKLESSRFTGPILTTKLMFKDEVICGSTSYPSMDVFKSDGEYY